MKKIIGVWLILYGLGIESSLSVVKYEPTVLDIKAVQSNKPSNVLGSTTIKVLTVRNPTILQEICSQIYNYLPDLIKKSYFENNNPFEQKLSNDKQVALAKKLLKSLNIAKKGVLDQTSFPYNKYTSINTFINAKTDYNYKQLTDLCTIILIIIEAPYVTLLESGKIYQDKINIIFNFVKNNIFKYMKFQEDENDGETKLIEVKRIIPGKKDEEYAFAETLPSKSGEIFYTIPIVPFDAIIFLAKILNDQTRAALESLGENITITEDEAYNVYFKIKFLDDQTFNLFLEDFEKSFKKFAKQLTSNYNINKSFLVEYLSSIKTTSNTLDLNEKIVKEALVHMYYSALHMIFLFGYTVTENFELKPDMSIVEICTMFLKLQDALENNLLPKNQNYAYEIKQYETVLKSIQEYFGQIYLNFKYLDPSYTKYPYQDFVSNLIKQFIDRFKEKKSEVFSYNDLYLLFFTKPFILDTLVKKTTPVERLSKKDLEILYTVMNYWWVEIENQKKVKLDPLPEFKELMNSSAKQVEMASVPMLLAPERKAILNRPQEPSLKQQQNKERLKKELKVEREKNEKLLEQKRLEVELQQAKLEQERLKMKAEQERLKQVEKRSLQKKEAKRLKKQNKKKSGNLEYEATTDLPWLTVESEPLPVEQSISTKNENINVPIDQPNQQIAEVERQSSKNPPATVYNSKTQQLVELKSKNTQQGWISWAWSLISPWAWYEWYSAPFEQVEVAQVEAKD